MAQQRKNLGLAGLFFLLVCLGPAGRVAAQHDSAAFNRTAGSLKIVRITPSGEDVPAERQIVLKFNQPVAPIGRMERTAEEIPVRITPALAGQWRWLDTSSLALQLNENERMKPSTKYVLRIEPGFVSLSGNRMEEGITHTFITIRPRIEQVYFRTWKRPGLPVFCLHFNQPVKKESVLAFVYLQAPDKKTVPLVESQQPNNQEKSLHYVEPATELALNAEYSVMTSPGVLSEEGPEPAKESRLVKLFHTYPEFEFVGIRGFDNLGGAYLQKPDGSVVNLPNQNGDCWSGPPITEKILFNPLQNVELCFSAPVPTGNRPELIFQPDLAGGRSGYNPWVDAPEDYRGFNEPHTPGNYYAVWLPAPLQAAREYQITNKSGLQDMFGRSLKNPIDIVLRTDHRPPWFFLNNQFSVLEKNEQTHLPLTLNNIREISAEYRILGNPSDFGLLADFVKCGGDFNADRTFQVKTDPAEDIAYAFPLKVREMLQGRSGAIAGYLSGDPSDPRDCSECIGNKFFSQVTNMALHVKLGHQNTIVWVTTLDKGEPVADARVALYLSGQEDPADTGTTDRNGLAVMKGTAEIDPQAEILRDGLENCERRESMPCFGAVHVKTEDDTVLLPLIREFMSSDGYRGYYDYDYPGNGRAKYAHMRAWGTAAQGIYKPGDTIQYKIYVRDQNNRIFIKPELSGYSLKIKNPAGEAVHQAGDITLNEFGAFHGEYRLPEKALSGWYQFCLEVSFGKDLVLYPMRVLVTDFTPAPFKVQTDLNGKSFKNGDQVKVETGARLHSGGPYGKVGVRTTATLQPVYYQPERQDLKEFTFRDSKSDYSRREIFQTEGSLDEKGDFPASFKLTDTGVIWGNIIVESAVRDDRGKYVASSATARFVGRDRLVGLRNTRWLDIVHEESGFQAVVVDENGQPVKGVPVEVVVEYDRITGIRVKGSGNAYLIQYQHNMEPVKTIQLETAGDPVAGKFIPAEPGSYRITARVKDTAGQTHSASLWMYAAGPGYILWEMPEDNSLPIIPAQSEYKVGERARFLVKNPFPGCRALITIERLGVIKKWTQIFNDNTPVVEFDIEPDFVPGFYLSVLVHSPRVDKPLDDLNVDLGKPTCREGYLTVPVYDPVKKLLVGVKADRAAYTPRQKVTIDVNVTDIHKNIPSSELAVVVLDESVLDLIQGGPDYFDPYPGFYKLGELDVRNFNLLFRLVGRQRFEKKGDNRGGSGGDAAFKIRDLFKFVCYWNPEILPDENGRARVSFDLPDNLTGWRVMVLAVTPDDLMGLGQTRFVTNRLTEIRPALPNQVTEGDSFDAVFTVMNCTDKERQLNVQLKAEGDAEAQPVSLQIQAKPFARNLVRLPVKALRSGEIRFTVRAGDALDQDGLTLALKVHPRKAVEAAASYGTAEAGEVVEPYDFPLNMRTDAGRVSVVASPAIISSLEGAFTYLRDYSYICWEQRLSKAVMAKHFLDLQPYLNKNLKWERASSVIENTLAAADSYQAPNGGMCYYGGPDEYVCPYLSAYTAIAFNWLKASGHQPDPAVETALDGYLADLLKRDIFPSFFSKGMSSTVRAVALAALAQNGKIQKSDLERYLPHVEYMDLFGMAHFLQAAVLVDGCQEMQAKVYEKIMGFANESGGKLIFTDPIFGENFLGGYERILTSEMRTNAAILSAFLTMEEMTKAARQSKSRNEQAAEAVLDLLNKNRQKLTNPLTSDSCFKLVRYLTQTRKSRDHWENTQENVFCMQALTAFSRLYDKETPDFTVKAAMDGKTFGQASFKDFRDPAAELVRPLTAADPGKKASLTLSKEGPGRLYYAARLFYSPADLKQDPVNAGIEVQREYYVEREKKWILLKSPMQIQQGELVRVDLFLSLPTARNFVVVADPVPGGLEPVNRDLATASQVDADKDAGIYDGGSWWYKFGDWQSYGYSRWSFYHRELLHHSVRFYSDYLPAGHYHLSYIAQAIAPGRFTVMPLHAEEMYDPDVFGQGVPAELIIAVTDR